MTDTLKKIIDILAEINQKENLKIDPNVFEEEKDGFETEKKIANELQSASKQINSALKKCSIIDFCIGVEQTRISLYVAMDMNNAAELISKILNKLKKK